MVRASKLFKMGRFNSAEFVTRGNITVVKIWREGWKKSYYFKVKDLGKKSEKIIEDQDVLEER